MTKQPHTSQDIAAYSKKIAAAKRLLAAQKARTGFLDFARLMMPDIEDPDNVDKSRFLVAPHHKLLAEVLEKVAKGEILRLCISLAPRHGKSEMCSRLFPAWFIGQDPYRQIIVAGASGDFATAEFGRKIKSLVTSPIYRQVFPRASLYGGSKSVENLVFTEGGNIKSIGKGAQVVGRGADCLTEDTLVITDGGEFSIKNLFLGSTPRKVLAYDTRKKELCWRRIEVVASRPATGIYRITTTSGRVVEATGEHPFFTGSGYTTADSLAPGHRLLLAVRDEGREAGRRLSQEPEAGSHGVLLHESLRVPPLQREAREGGEALSWVREARESSQDWNVLLEGMLGPNPAEAEKCHGSEVGVGSVQSVRREYSASDSDLHTKGMLQAMRSEDTLKGNDGTVQPRIQARDGEIPDAGVSERLGEGEQGNPQARWSEVRDLRQFQSGSARSPHRPDPNEQCPPEPRHAVRSMPLHVSRCGAFRTEEDTVALVERVRRDCTVYNLQVEGTENFFANGVLTHNCLIVDDPISGLEEAMSPSEREKLWGWFTSDAMSRLMPGGRVIVIHQRWHNSDLIGRLVDPECPEYDPEIAAKWTHVKLPAVIESENLSKALGIPLEVQTDPEITAQFGTQPISALWPERFGLKFFAELRRQNPKSFEALYRGAPRLEEGEFFKADWFKGYKAHELPRNLRTYMAGDFAVSTKQTADKTCLIPVGVDEQGIIWVFPDIVWRRMDAEDTVDAIISMIKRHKPLFFWAEKGHISQSIGPFLRKRMQEEGAVATIVEKTPAKDKMTRAQAFNALVSLGRVRFPTFAPWWRDAEAEMLRFPEANHDDLVDTLAWLGIGLTEQVKASPIRKKETGPREGTLGWIKQASRWEAKQKLLAYGDGF